MKRTLMRTLQGLGIFFGGLFALFLLLAVSILIQIPSKAKIRGCITTELYKVKLCPGSKNYVPLKQISPYLQKAVVLTEDSAFFTHHGFDFQEIQKSFEKNLETGRFARGGSTISQQLAKNMFLSAEKTIQRKILEAVITIQIEKTLSKNEILERYLNVVEFGPKIYGVKAAADFYFKKAPAKLDVIESAFLAFLLPSPQKYSVSFYKKQLTPFARKRLSEIIDRLHQYQRISYDEHTIASYRLNGFLSGSESHAPPADLDLDAPEEEGFDDLLLQPFGDSPNRQMGQSESDRQQYAEPDQQPNLEPVNEEATDDLDGVSEGGEINNRLEEDVQLIDGEEGSGE